MTTAFEPHPRCFTGSPPVPVWLTLVALTAVCASAARADEGMSYPLAAAVGSDGAIYVADRDLPGVWKFADDRWSVHFRGSKKLRTPLNAVRCLAIDAQGKLLAGDSATREIYRFDDAGQPQPLTNGLVGIPMALTVAPDGAIFASDLERQRIVKISAAGGEPVDIAQPIIARGLAIDTAGSLIAVCHGDETIVRITPDDKRRQILMKGRPFRFSHHVVVGTKGEFYVADGYAKTVWKIEGEGPPVAVCAGDPLKNPVGLAWRGDHLLIVDPHAKAIFELTGEGTLVRLGEPASG